MPLLDLSDGPVPMEDTPVKPVATLYASVLCMADELDRAFAHLPLDLLCRTLARACQERLVDLSAALLAWIEAQEARHG